MSAAGPRTASPIRRAVVAAWSARPWRYRFVAVVVGEYSGNVSRLSFVRFRRETSARRWIAQMNETPSMAAHFEYRPIDD